MIFLTEEDVRTVIRDEILELVTEIADGDEAVDANDVMDKAEGSAISKMKSYLSKRYDVAKAFSPGEEYQDKEMIIEFCVDIMLYRLHARNNPRKIPEIRRERYMEALAWLEDTRDGKNNPTLPDLPEDSEGSNDVLFGDGIDSETRYY